MGPPGFSNTSAHGRVLQHIRGQPIGTDRSKLIATDRSKLIASAPHCICTAICTRKGVAEGGEEDREERALCRLSHPFAASPENITPSGEEATHVTANCKWFPTRVVLLRQALGLAISQFDVADDDGGVPTHRSCAHDFGHMFFCLRALPFGGIFRRRFSFMALCRSENDQSNGCSNLKNVLKHLMVGSGS